MDVVASQREADLQARVEALTADNQRLRDRVEELEAEVGAYGRVPFPPEWCLTGKESALVEALLASKGVATKEHLMIVLYGGLAEVEMKIIDVFICKARKKLEVFGIEISTVWGRGYMLTEPSRAIIRAALAELAPVADVAA